MEIWEPEPPGNLRACPGIYLFYLYRRNILPLYKWVKNTGTIICRRFGYRIFYKLYVTKEN
jgi:hypothetical protein